MFDIHIHMRITGKFAPLIGKSCKYIILFLMNHSAMVITAAQVTITSRLIGLHRWIGTLKLPGLKMTIRLVGGTKCITMSNVLKVNTVWMYLTVITIISRRFRLSHVRRCNRCHSRIYFLLFLLLWRSGCCLSWSSSSENGSKCSDKQCICTTTNGSTNGFTSATSNDGTTTCHGPTTACYDAAAAGYDDAATTTTTANVSTACTANLFLKTV